MAEPHHETDSQETWDDVFAIRSAVELILNNVSEEITDPNSDIWACPTLCGGYINYDVPCGVTKVHLAEDVMETVLTRLERRGFKYVSACFHDAELEDEVEVWISLADWDGKETGEEN